MWRTRFIAHERRSLPVPFLVSHWRGSHGRTWPRWSCSWWQRWHSCMQHSDGFSWVQGAESHQPCSQWKLQNTTYLEIGTIQDPLFIFIYMSRHFLNFKHWGVLPDQRLGQLIPLRFVCATVGLINAGFLGVHLFFGKSRIQQIHQLVTAILLQQLGLKGRFTWLKLMNKLAFYWIPVSKQCKLWDVRTSAKNTGSMAQTSCCP